MNLDLTPRARAGAQIERRTAATILSLPIILVVLTIALLGLWALLAVSLMLALLASAALVAIGLAISVLLARRSWRRRFPSRQP